MAGLQARSPIITREDFLLKTTPIPNVTCTGTNLAILLIRAHLADRMHPCSHLFACPCFPHLPAYFVRPSAPDHVRWSWWGFGAGHGDWRGSALGRWPVNVIGRRPRFGFQPVEHCPRSTSVCHGSIAEMLASWQFTLGYWNSTRQVGSWRHQLPQSWREEMEGASRLCSSVRLVHFPLPHSGARDGMAMTSSYDIPSQHFFEASALCHIMIYLKKRRLITYVKWSSWL